MCDNPNTNYDKKLIETAEEMYNLYKCRIKRDEWCRVASYIKIFIKEEEN